MQIFNSKKFFFKFKISTDTLFWHQKSQAQLWSFSCALRLKYVAKWRHSFVAIFIALIGLHKFWRWCRFLLLVQQTCHEGFCAHVVTFLTPANFGRSPLIKIDGLFVRNFAASRIKCNSAVAFNFANSAWKLKRLFKIEKKKIAEKYFSLYINLIDDQMRR